MAAAKPAPESTPESAPKAKPKKTRKNAPADPEAQRLLDEAIARRDKLAESQLDMAEMFVNSGKLEIARRRWRQIAEEFDGLPAAEQARALLKKSRG